MLERFNLIYYDYLHSRIVLENQAGQEFCKASSLRAFVNEQALCYGRSLQGCEQSVSRIMNLRKYRPILISTCPLIVLVPDHSWKSGDLKLIQVGNLVSFRMVEKSRCLLSFQDGQILEMEEGKRLFRLLNETLTWMNYIFSSQSSQ